MTTRGTSAITLAVLGVLTLVAAVVGWTAMTAPFPAADDLPPCVRTEIQKGQEVFPDQVTISVHNASSRNGLASRTMSDLTERGFVSGGTGNATDAKKIRGVQIWADNGKNPAVALVRAQFRSAKVVSGSALGPGVVIVVGDGDVSLAGAKKSPTSVKAKSPASICSPPGSDDGLTTPAS